MVEASRRAQALAYIERYITERGCSPSIGDIAKALGVSASRAKALVHALARERSIVREPGAQRGISVPGLAERNAIGELAARGWTINPRIRRADPPPCPQGHLPIVAVLTHIPEPGDSGGGDGDIHGGGDRAAARRAPGDGRAAPEAQGHKPA